MPELARLGVSPSFHINHIYDYGDALADALLGPERAARLLPVKTAFDLGRARSTGPTQATGSGGRV